MFWKMELTLQNEIKTKVKMKHCYFALGVMLLTATSAANADEWRPIGMATVVDGWITPGYVDEEGKQINPATCPFQVPVEENVTTPGIYKLINPFGSADFHLSNYNLKPEAADIVIDARDRTFVIIQPQYSGFTDADADEASGTYTYYITDMGTAMYNMGQQREVINLLKCASVMLGNDIIVRQPAFCSSATGSITGWETSFPARITLPDNSAEEDAKWESLGTATVTDGWIVPGFKDDNDIPFVNTEHRFTCKIEMNADNPDLLCLVSPYKSADFDMAYSNLSSSNVRIIIDTTDPDFVTVAPQFSGYISREDNDIRSYYIADAGYQLEQRGQSREQIKANHYNSTMGDQTITIPMPLFGFDIDNVGKMWNNSQAMTISWKGNGVSDIAGDNADCPVEYYNLQGVRVDNPATGNLYIRRQGTDVRKVVF